MSNCLGSCTPRSRAFVDDLFGSAAAHTRVWGSLAKRSASAEGSAERPASARAAPAENRHGRGPAGPPNAPPPAARPIPGGAPAAVFLPCCEALSEPLVRAPYQPRRSPRDHKAHRRTTKPTAEPRGSRHHDLPGPAGPQQPAPAALALRRGGLPRRTGHLGLLVAAGHVEGEAHCGTVPRGRRAAHHRGCGM